MCVRASVRFGVFICLYGLNKSKAEITRTVDFLSIAVEREQRAKQHLATTVNPTLPLVAGGDYAHTVFQM